MLDEISPKQFESLEVPLEQDGVIFVRGLESGDGLGHGNFHPLGSCCKEFILLLHWLFFSFQLLRQDLNLPLGSVEGVHGCDQVLPQA